MNKKQRLNLQLAIAVILIVFGLVILMLGFYAPPVGEIHSSVLVAYGEVMTFAGSLIGIYYHFNHKQYLKELQEQARNNLEEDNEKTEE